MDDRLQAILGELRRGLEFLYGDRLARLVLFGSRARGDAAPDSDIAELLTQARDSLAAAKMLFKNGYQTLEVAHGAFAYPCRRAVCPLHDRSH